MYIVSSLDWFWRSSTFKGMPYIHILTIMAMVSFTHAQLKSHTQKLKMLGHPSARSGMTIGQLEQACLFHSTYYHNQIISLANCIEDRLFQAALNRNVSKFQAEQFSKQLIIRLVRLSETTKICARQWVNDPCYCCPSDHQPNYSSLAALCISPRRQNINYLIKT